MIEFPDDEIGALERQMRRKLLFDGPSRRANNFTIEEQAIADKLLGKIESQRLQNRRNNSQPFKPKPQQVHYEYWRFDGGDFLVSGYRLSRVENGWREDHYWTGEIEEEIKSLRAKGFTVREIRLGDYDKPRYKQQESQKKNLLDRLSQFKFGARP